MDKMKPFKYWSQVVLPQAYDDALSYYEVLNRVVTYLNNIDVNFNSLSDEIGKTNTNVAAISAEIDKLRADINALIVQAGYFTPQQYGAVGDGVTNDAKAFSDAFRAAHTSSGYLIIPHGRYNIAGIGKADLPPNVIGDCATLIANGEKDQLVYGKYLKMLGVNFEVSGTGAAPIIVYSEVADEIVICNADFVATDGNDNARYYKGIRVYANKATIANCTFKNFIHGVIFNNSADVVHESFNVNNITGYNVATLVDLEGTYNSTSVRGGGEFNTASISNIALYNTAANKASITDIVGRDAVLVGGCKTLYVSNVYGEYCKERVVYINNVSTCNVDNVSGRHSQIIKVAGTSKAAIPYISTDITISNVAGYDVDDGYLLTLYDVDGVTADNLCCHNSLDGLDCAPLIGLERTCKNIAINNVTITNATRGAVALTYADGYTNIIDNVKLSNFLCYNPVIKTQYDVIRIDDASATDKWINRLVIDNFNVNPGSTFYRSNSVINNLITINHASNVMLNGFVLRDSRSVNGGISIGEDVSNIEIHADVPTATRAAYLDWVSKLNLNSAVVGRGNTSNSNVMFTSLGASNGAHGISAGSYTVTAGVSFGVAPEGSPCIVVVDGPKKATFTFNGSSLKFVSGDTGFTPNHNELVIDTSGLYYIRCIW